jgi:large subunit ribosomal protein L3
MRGLIGKKIGMTRIFDESGFTVPVTILELGPCNVVQVKTESCDGYDSVQVGFANVSMKSVNKPSYGHFNKYNSKPKSILREFKPVPGFKYASGQTFDVSIFNVGDYVTVTGKSKGRGFSGVIKRHNFARQKKTHGTGHTERSPGSIGQASDPSRVFPGMKMAGRYGNSNISVENLKIVKIDKDNNYIMVKGAVPGSRNSTVTVLK